MKRGSDEDGFLNLLTTDEDTLREAFDSVEYKGFYDYSNQGGNTKFFAIFHQGHENGSS